MAILLDSSTAVTATIGASSKTFAHTCSALANGILWVAAGSSSTDVTGVTYNGAAMTKSSSVNLGGSWSSLWYKVGPSSGTNNIVITCAGAQNITGGAVSFTGANQTGVPDSHFENVSQTGSVTSYSIPTTTVANNCFLVFSGRANGGAALTAGANTTVTQPEVAALGDFLMYSTAAITPAGTGTLAVTSSAQQFFGVVASFAPFTNFSVTVSQASYTLSTTTITFRKAFHMAVTSASFVLTTFAAVMTKLRFFNLTNKSTSTFTPTNKTP